MQLIGMLGVIVSLSMVELTLARAPKDLSNFQSIYACNESVKRGRPRSYGDVTTLINAYAHVKATGEGHSWWQESFCSGEDKNSVNIITSSLASSIQVDEARQTVRVSAGVITRDLLDYLARFRPSRNLPITMGYTLPAFPWFIDQSIGGAVATASHGSSMMHGTLSKQTVGMTVALPNGTIAKVTRDTHPHLMRALLCNIGRLGIVLDLELKIAPNNPVRRQKTEVDGKSFVESMKEVQQAYIQGGEDAKVVQALGQSEFLWYFANDKLNKWTFDELDSSIRTTSYSVLLNADAAVRNQLDSLIYANGGSPTILNRFTPELVEGFSAEWTSDSGEASRLVESGVVPEAIQLDPVSNFMIEWLAPRDMLNFNENLLNMVFPEGIFNRRDSYLAQTEILSYLQTHMGVYDQYEVAIPLSKAGDCFEELRSQMNTPATGLSPGFPIPGLVRFVAGEDAYLSPVEGEARVYLNIEDYYSKSRRYDSNPEFMEGMRILRGPKCSGRLHWGKAGWPAFASDFDGTAEYPKWCDFGCAVRELDPTNKFKSLANVWSWEGIDLDKCCTSDGFSSECKCARS